MLPPLLRPKPQDLEAAAKETQEIQEAISYLRDFKGEGHAQIMARLAPVVDNSPDARIASSPPDSQLPSHPRPAFDYPYPQEPPFEPRSPSEELFSQSTSVSLPTTGFGDFEEFYFDNFLMVLDLNIAEGDNI